MVKHVIVAEKVSKCFSIAITILKKTFGKDVTTKALTDSGSSINSLQVNHSFVRKHNLPHFCLPTPVQVKNIVGSYNQSGVIKFITTLFIRIQGIVHQVLFHIINCGNENVILGDFWL